MSMMKAGRTLTTVQSPTAVDQFLMTKMPSNPTARQEWCKERLLERRQQVLGNWNTPVLNQMKLPRRKPKCTDNAVWIKSQHSLKDKSASHRLIARFNGRTTARIKSKKPCEMQLFIHSSSNTPIVYTTQSTATVSSIIKWYKKKNNILSHDICLSTSTGFKLCEALTLEDNGVGNDANIYINIADIGLKGGADDKGSQQGSKNGDAAECRKTIREWSKEDVRRWTAEVVQLDGKYVEALFEEEVDGETLLLYKKEDLRTDFEMNRGPIMKLERNLKILQGDIKNKGSVEEIRIQLPVNISRWTVDHVESWLISIRLDEKYVTRFKKEEVDGQVLKLFTATRIADLTKTFKLPCGPMRKLLYHVENIVRMSDTCTGMETDKQLQQDLQEVTIDTKQAQIPQSDKKIHEFAKGSIDLSTHREKHNKKPAITSNIRHQRAQKYIKMLNEKAFLDLAPITEPDVLNCNKTCSLTLLYSKWGKVENLLEKQFCFLILTPQKELTQNKIELLWAQLQNSCNLLVDMLPVEKKQLFENKSKSMQSTVVRADDKQPLSIRSIRKRLPLQKYVFTRNPMFVTQVTYTKRLSEYKSKSTQSTVVRADDKQSLSIRNTGVRMCPLMQKDEAVIAAHSVFVVLVDNEMLTSRKHSYITYLDKEKNLAMLLTFDQNSPFAASYDSRSPGFKLTFSKRKYICKSQNSEKKDTLYKSLTDISCETAYSHPYDKAQISKKTDSGMPLLPVEDIGTDGAHVWDAGKDQGEKTETYPVLSLPDNSLAVLKNASLNQCQDVKSYQKPVTTGENDVSEFMGNGTGEGVKPPSRKSEDGNLTVSHLKSKTPSNISGTLPSSIEHEDDQPKMIHFESSAASPIDKSFTSDSTERERSIFNAELSYQATEPSERDDSDTLSTMYQSKRTCSSPVDLLYQKPSSFDCDVENCTYSYKRVLEVIETGRLDMVSFYLGFGWTGPVAYNVSRDTDEQELGPETPETRHVPDSEERTTVQETVKNLNYQQYKRQHSKLARTLQQINELKKKKNEGKQLEKNQMEKLSREEDIKEELANLEKEYQKDMESNPEFLQDYY